MPSELETAIEEMISVFYKYSTQEGNKNHLSRGELQELLQKELMLPEWARKDPSYVDKILKSLDEDKDGKMSFQEYVNLVTNLILSYTNF